MKKNKFLLLVFTIYFVLIIPSLLVAQSKPSPTPTPTLDNSTSVDTRTKELNEAQIEYYKMQASKLEEEKGLFQKIVSIGTLAAALVALITFLFNYRTNVQTQLDTQFYEALERFGNHESATLRASAAGLIGQLGTAKKAILSTWWLLAAPLYFSRGSIVVNKWRFLWQWKYLETAFDQLTTGLLLETNPIVRESINNAIKVLVLERPRWASEKLYDFNLKLKENLFKELAHVFSAMKISNISQITNGHLERVGNLAAYDGVTLREIINYSKLFENYIPSASKKVNLISPTKLPEYLSEAEAKLQASAEYLNYNIELCSAGFKAFPGKDFISYLSFENWMNLYLPSRNYNGIFLPNANLMGSSLAGYDFDDSFFSKANLEMANLKDCSFLNANLYGASLLKANLKKANLSASNLRSANFQNAEMESVIIERTTLTDTILINANLLNAKLTSCDLTGAKLYGAKILIKDYTSYPTFWWKGNFSDPNNNIDEVLLNMFYKSYFEPETIFSRNTPYPKFELQEFPESTDEMHQSVRQFVENKRNESVTSQSSASSNSEINN